MTTHAECKECGKTFRGTIPELAFMKVAGHLKQEHGVSEQELTDDIETQLEEMRR